MSAQMDIRTPYLRRRRILELLHAHKVITLDDLQKELDGVSLSTVRRDALALQTQGKVLLLRGGSVKPYNADRDELPVEEKEQLFKSNKERIAKCAAGCVRAGETIYIDSGTTTAMMVRYLREMKITIVTSSTHIIKEVDRFVGNLIVLGGEVNRELASISGPITDQQLSGFYFDRSFVGASGFSQEGGISTYDLRESSKKRIVQERSRTTYVLADSSKAGRSALCRAFSLRDCVVITDAKNEVTSLADTIIAP